MISELDLALGLRSGVLGAIHGPREELEAARLVSALVGGGSLEIRNLKIRGKLDWAHCEVSKSLRFVNCMLDSIDASYLHATGDVSFVGCEIASWHGPGAYYERELRFEAGTRILDCSMRSARFERGFVVLGSRIRNLSLANTHCQRDIVLDGSYIRVLRLVGAVALSELSMVKATIGTIFATAFKTETIRGTALTCGTITLRRVRIDGSIHFDGATISVAAWLTNTTVGSVLNLSDAVVKAVSVQRLTCRALNVARLTVYDDVSIAFSTFDVVELGGKCFGNFSFRYNRCTGPVMAFGLFVQRDLSFDNNTVGASVQFGLDGFIHPTVRGTASFVGTSAVGQFIIKFARFESRLSLLAVKGRDVFLRDSRMRGDLVLSNVRADQTISLKNSIIDGSVNARAVHAGRNFIVDDAEIKGSMTLEGVQIDNNLSAVGSKIGSLVAEHIDVRGSVKLDRASIKTDLQFIGCRLGELLFAAALAERGMFAFPPSVMLRDTQYGAFSGNWRDLNDALLAHGTYDATAPKALEQRLRAVGRTHWADEVYFLSRQRARRVLPRISQLGQLALEWTSGYGAKPTRLLRAIFLVFVALTSLQLVAATITPKLMGGVTGSPWAFCALGALDVLLRGERSSEFTITSSSRAYPMIVQLLLLASLTLRYFVIGLLGIWLAYLTGLIRYVSGPRS